MSDPASVQVYEALAAAFEGLGWAWEALGWAIRPYVLIALLFGVAYFSVQLYAIYRWMRGALRAGTGVPPVLRHFLPTEEGRVPLVFQQPAILLLTGGAILAHATSTLVLATFWFIPVSFLAVAFAGDVITGLAKRR